jgi:hypothetical protein
MNIVKIGIRFKPTIVKRSEDINENIIEQMERDKECDKY